MEKFDWKWTIRRNICMLRILGLWPNGDESYKLNFYSIYSFTIMVLFIGGPNFFQTINLYFYPDFEIIAGTIFITLSELLVIPKVYYVIMNMRGLKQLMTTLNSDLFRPKSIKQVKLILPNLSKWTKVCMIFWFVVAAALAFLALFPILDSTIQERRLPFLAWYPYDSKTSPFYEITYVYQVVGSIVIATTVMNVDTLIAALNMYIGAQCDILCDNLRCFSKAGGNVSDKLIVCIKHHREILKFAQNCNNFFNWIVFFQFFVSAASIGITLFQITVVQPFSTEFFSVLGFGIAVLIDIFLYCWFGNEVIVKSSNIPNAIFESDWISAPLEVKKNLIFLIRKCQQPIKISALNIFCLSLETFVTILRASWSYFALFHRATA